MPIRGRHSPKQINTIQGAAEKQDELVSLNKHQTAYSQRQSNTALLFSTVCLPMTSTLTCRAIFFSARSNPVLGTGVSGTPLVRLVTPVSGGIFYNKSNCVCFGLDNHMMPKQLVNVVILVK